MNPPISGPWLLPWRQSRLQIQLSLFQMQRPSVPQESGLGYKYVSLKTTNVNSDHSFSSMTFCFPPALSQQQFVTGHPLGTLPNDSYELNLGPLAGGFPATNWTFDVTDLSGQVFIDIGPVNYSNQFIVCVEGGVLLVWISASLDTDMNRFIKNQFKIPMRNAPPLSFLSQQVDLPFCEWGPCLRRTLGGWDFWSILSFI